MVGRIYLDHQATTPPDPRVLEAMLPWLSGRFGNPASPHHAWGWDAQQALETARAAVGDLLGAQAREIVFTSGGTEADNLAVLGCALAQEAKGRHIVTSRVESRPVRDACAALAARGWTITEVGVDERARVDPGAVLAAIRDDTTLVSIQVANPEVGTLQDVAALGAVAAQRRVPFHVDATAALLWVALDVQSLGVTLLSLSGHRMHGPMGIGALYVRQRPRMRLVPLLVGGGHERGLRGGAPNLPGAIGLGRAAAIVREERTADAARVQALRDRLEGALGARVTGTLRLGDPGHRLPNTAAMTIAGVEGEALVLAVPSVAMATGSACASASFEPSPVLAAMGLDKRSADTSVRFTLGRFTSAAEIDEVVGRVHDAVERVRAAGRPAGGGLVSP